MNPKQTSYEELKERVRKGLKVHTHSGTVGRGEVFVALPGSKVDGAQFIPQALEKGAGYVIGSNGVAEYASRAKDTEFITHQDPREALGELAAAYHGTSNLPFPVVGVTGTNGKTTICYLLEHLFTQNGRKVGVVGTVSYRWPGVCEDASRTTPGCWELHSLLARMRDAGVDVVVMEVSSHALDQKRVAGITFAAGALTNVTQDHLDYHGDMDSYFKTKAGLFESVPDMDKACVVNWDDKYGRRILQGKPSCIGFGFNAPETGMSGLQGKILENSIAGLKLEMCFQEQTWTLSSPLAGEHNGSNLLAAQGLALALGCTPGEMDVLSGFMGVPGRLERIGDHKNRNVFVDYAHTPDALDNVLRAMKQLTPGRLITVFGCGGDRDKGKRPLMGEAACRHSDVVILTSDNPRYEDPVAIMHDVRPGLTGCALVLETPDRRNAISAGISEMRAGDVLVVAGKGHETYQEIKGIRYNFSDQDVIREMLR